MLAISAAREWQHPSLRFHDRGTPPLQYPAAVGHQTAGILADHRCAARGQRSRIGPTRNIMSGIAIRAKGFIGQLKQRGVFKVVSIYVVAAWGTVTGAVQLVPIVGAPTWVVEAVALLAAIGLPIATVVAWMFEATPEGLIRDRGDGGWGGRPRAPTCSARTA